MAEIEDSLPSNNLIKNKLRVGEYVRCRNEHKMFQKEEIFQKRWKMFHPSGKEENQSGTRRKRGKENTRGAVVWISFLF